MGGLTSRSANLHLVGCPWTGKKPVFWSCSIPGSCYTGIQGPEIALSYLWHDSNSPERVQLTDLSVLCQ